MGNVPRGWGNSSGRLIPSGSGTELPRVAPVGDRGRGGDGRRVRRGTRPAAVRPGGHAHACRHRHCHPRPHRHPLPIAHADSNPAFAVRPGGPVERREHRCLRGAGIGGAPLLVIWTPDRNSTREVPLGECGLYSHLCGAGIAGSGLLGDQPLRRSRRTFRSFQGGKLGKFLHMRAGRLGRDRVLGRRQRWPATCARGAVRFSQSGRPSRVCDAGVG